MKMIPLGTGVSHDCKPPPVLCPGPPRNEQRHKKKLCFNENRVVRSIERERERERERILLRIIRIYLQ